MSLFSVDEEKCGLCGTCVAVCPAGLIEIGAAGSVPTFAESNDDACRDCGHCVAVCPNEALAHRCAAPEQCLPVRDKLQVTTAQVAQLMRGRRSVRNYQDRPVARETIRDLLDIARFAPSGCNTQPVHWLVIHDTKQVRLVSEMIVDNIRHVLKQDTELPIRDILERLLKAWDEGKDFICRGAPHLILAHATREDPLASTACIIAQTYLELAASASGLGTCWIGLIDTAANSWPPMKQFLALPEDHLVFGSMALGHPRFKYPRIPLRKELR